MKEFRVLDKKEIEVNFSTIEEEELTTRISDIPSGKKALVSDGEKIISIIDTDTYLYPHAKLVSIMDSAFKEHFENVVDELYFISDDFLRLDVYIKFSDSLEIAPSEIINIGLAYSSDLSTGNVRLWSIGWNKDIPIISFLSKISLRRGRRNVPLDLDVIETGVVKLKDKFQGISVNIWKSFLNDLIDEKATISTIDYLKIGKRLRENLMDGVIKNLLEKDKLNKWDLFNGLMFFVWKFVSYKNMNILYSKISKEFSGRNLCYQGVPHRYIVRKAFDFGGGDGK